MKKILLLIILLLGLGLRLYHLSSLPPELTWDEAALGYNAFSILRTARDEHGTLLPLTFKSFGDYKPGLYIYATVPSVALFGLNRFSARLPSALAGTLAIFGLYLLIDLLFPPKNKKQILTPALLASFSLALAPWHLLYSHGAWETNLFTTLLLFALYFYLRFLRSKSFPLYPAAILASLTLITYQAAKFLTPSILIITTFIYFSDFKSRFRKFNNKLDRSLLALVILFVAYLLFQNLFGVAGNRLSRLSYFNFTPHPSEQLEMIDPNPFIRNLFHFSPYDTIKSIASRYFYHFSPELLFYQGSLSLPRETIPGIGLLHLFDFVWLIIGFIYLGKFFNRSSFLLLGLLLIAPLPASLTLSEYSTFRSLFMIIPLSAIIGLGLSYLLSSSRLLFLVFLPFYLYSVIFSLDIFYNHAPAHMSEGYNYGYQQAIDFVKKFPAADHVVFTDVFGQPYIYYLFYTQYDPALYQSQNDYHDAGIDVGFVGHVGNVSFQQFSSSEISISPNTVFVGTEGNIPNDFNLSNPEVEYFEIISSPDNKPVFRALKTL